MLILASNVTAVCCRPLTDCVCRSTFWFNFEPAYKYVCVCVWCVCACGSSSVPDTAPVRACTVNVPTALTAPRQRLQAAQRQPLPDCWPSAAHSLSFSCVRCNVRNRCTLNWEPASSHCTCSTYSSRAPAFSRFKFCLHRLTLQLARGTHVMPSYCNCGLYGLVCKTSVHSVSRGYQSYWVQILGQGI